MLFDSLRTKVLIARRRCGAVAITLVLVVAPAVGVHPVKQYQLDRLTAFLHPSDNPAKQGYQQHQALIAVGSGEKTGRGALATQARLDPAYAARLAEFWDKVADAPGEADAINLDRADVFWTLLAELRALRAQAPVEAA